MKYFFMVLVMLFISCTDNTPKNPTSDDSIVNIGHGVYYFATNGEKFGIELAKFKTSHNIISISSDNRGGQGSTIGYFVLCKEE